MPFAIKMLHANSGRQLTRHVECHQRRTIRTTGITHMIVSMMILVVVSVVKTSDVARKVHAFVPSTSTWHHHHHHQQQLDRHRSLFARGVTTSTSTTTDPDGSGQIINAVTNKDISQMSFRQLQHHVRTLMMMNDPDNVNHKAEEITRGMTTSILREKIRSYSNLCVIRDDGVEDCSYDDERVSKIHRSTKTMARTLT